MKIIWLGRWLWWLGDKIMRFAYLLEFGISADQEDPDEDDYEATS